MPIKYSYIFCAPFIGSMVMSDLLAGFLYDMEAQKQGEVKTKKRPVVDVEVA